MRRFELRPFSAKDNQATDAEPKTWRPINLRKAQAEETSAPQAEDQPIKKPGVALRPITFKRKLESAEEPAEPKRQASGLRIAVAPKPAIVQKPLQRGTSPKSNGSAKPPKFNGSAKPPPKPIVAAKPVLKAIVRPTERAPAVERAIVKPAVKPVERGTLKPVERAIVKPIVKPVVKPVVKPIVRAIVKPAAKGFIHKPTERAIVKPPSERRILKPIEKIKPIERETVEPVEEETVGPVEEGSSSGDKPRRDFPPECPWCDVALNSVIGCAQHCQGKKHRNKVAAACAKQPKRPRTEGELRFESVEQMWASAIALQMHLDAGFNTDLMQDPAAIEARSDSVRAMALLQPPDKEWVKTENRWIVTWNGEPAGCKCFPLTQAPQVADIHKRLFYDTPPPRVKLPSSLPQNLPAAKETQPLRMMWPNEPNSRLSFAVLEHQNIPITDMHVICNTALIYACTGDSSYTKDGAFYLQWYQGITLCAIYTPKAKVWALDTAGHRVEQLITDPPPIVKTSGKQRRSHHAISVLNIGDHRVCVTSEIDAHDSPQLSDAATHLVEIKSSRRGTQSMLGVHACTQMVCNGSKRVVCCHVDQSNSQLLEIEELEREEATERWSEGFLYAGQRARTVLDRIMNADMVLNAMLDHSVVKMTFDEGKAPVFELAYGVQVIPCDMPYLNNLNDEWCK